MRLTLDPKCFLLSLLSPKMVGCIPKAQIPIHPNASTFPLPQVVTALCAEAGAEVIQMEVFERQDAVAITAASVEQAKHCMVQLQLHQVGRALIV